MSQHHEEPGADGAKDPDPRRPTLTATLQVLVACAISATIASVHHDLSLAITVGAAVLDVMRAMTDGRKSS
jgi:hypothetical protein